MRKQDAVRHCRRFRRDMRVLVDGQWVPVEQCRTVAGRDGAFDMRVAYTLRDGRTGTARVGEWKLETKVFIDTKHN